MKKFRRFLFYLLGLGVAVGGTVFLLVKLQRIPDSPQAALDQFYQREVAEDQLMDPKRRRYAVLALGNIGEPAALGVLSGIATNTSEKDYIRCDALRSVALIDYSRAQNIIDDVIAKSNPKCMQKLHNEILTLDFKEWKSKNDHVVRSYLDALVGRHM